jgi:hypothetical protein
MGHTMRITFDKIELKATRRWIDPETGKKRQQTKTFMQTVNPFNKLPDGTVKDRVTIMAELHAERRDWLADTSGESHG